MKKKSKGKYLNQTSRKSTIPLILVSVIALFGLLATGIFFITRSNNNNVTISNAEEAISHAKKLGKEYGYENAMDELTEKHTSSIDGDSYYRLQQNYHGIPVYGKTLVYATDEKGNITSVTGNIEDIHADLNLHPTVTRNQIISSIQNNISSIPYLDDVGELIPDQFDNNLCVVILPENDSVHLAYSLQIGIYKILLDAHNANILSITTTVMSELSDTTATMGYKASDAAKVNGFPIEKITDNYFIMRDTDKKISVYTLNHRNSMENGIIFDSSKGSLLESTDPIFGNDEAEAALEYETGAELLINVVQIYDYFEELGFKPGVPKINLYYNDGYSAGNNALGGADSEMAIVSLGANTGVNCIDVISHEYTHFVSQELVEWIGASENGALNEAISDIFGLIIEAEVNHQPIDWKMYNVRNIKQPEEQDNPTVYRGINWGDTTNLGKKENDYGNIHKNSTVISHAAYLMWNGIDGTESKKISTSDLAELWYRTMLMMPSDCNFIECRRFAEYAAQSMKALSEQQVICVSEAFDKVRIISDDPVKSMIDYQLSDISTLSVYDKNGDLYSGYTLDVKGFENELFISENVDGTLNFYNGGSLYEDTKNATETPLTLDLPYGCYTFTITDSYNPDYTYSFTVSVGSNGTENNIDLFTAFEKPLVVTITDPTVQEDTYSQITPGFYAQIDNELNRLTIHEATSNNITFTAWWYRIWDIYKTNATLSGNIASFNFTASNNDALHASGTIKFQENTAILTLTECTQAYVDTGEYRYELIGVLFSEDQLKIISSALGVPEDLEVQITQGEPSYWDGGGFYRTPIEIYYNGELVAGASVNSLTGELAGSIYMYTAPTSTSNSGFNIESTFGFEKAWDIHDRSTTEHFVTSLAFNEDGTFSCGVGWYLSEWHVAFTGTYEVSGDEIILHYILDGQEKTTSYQVKWDAQTIRQASEENLVIPHQIGSEYPFEENPWYSADDLANQVEVFIRYSE